VVPIADFESDVIFEVAEALRVPVLILTMLALAVVLIDLGGFAAELMRRRRRDFKRLEAVTEEAQRKLVDRNDYLGAQESLKQVAWSASMGKTLAFLVSQWARPGGEGKMAKALADFDFGSLRRLERTRMLVRAGPALGLMGTLIPLSPALAGLAGGDVQELTENLRVAFSVTVLGLLIGAVAFAISLVRDRLYGQDLSDLEFVANALTGPAPSERPTAVAVPSSGPQAPAPSERPTAVAVPSSGPQAPAPSERPTAVAMPSSGPQAPAPEPLGNGTRAEHAPEPSGSQPS
jgi:biopolymer transport protein ExbB/TolQ